MTPLRQKMINDMKLRRFSTSTQQAYVDAVASLAKFFNQSPDRLNEENVQAYLLHLMEERKLSWSSCNVAVSGLCFFYGKTLGSPFNVPGYPTQEAKKAATRNTKHRGT